MITRYLVLDPDHMLIQDCNTKREAERIVKRYEGAYVMKVDVAEPIDPPKFAKKIDGHWIN
jgi:hypothetical protein